MRSKKKLLQSSTGMLAPSRVLHKRRSSNANNSTLTGSLFGHNKNVIITYSKSRPVQVINKDHFLTPDTPQVFTPPVEEQTQGGSTLKTLTAKKVNPKDSLRKSVLLRQGGSYTSAASQSSMEASSFERSKTLQSTKPNLALRNISNIPIDKTLSRTPCTPGAASPSPHTISSLSAMSGLATRVSTARKRPQNQETKEKVKTRQDKETSTPCSCNKKQKLMMASTPDRTTYFLKSMSTCTCRSPGSFCSRLDRALTAQSMSLCTDSLQVKLQTRAAKCHDLSTGGGSHTTSTSVQTSAAMCNDLSTGGGNHTKFMSVQTNDVSHDDLSTGGGIHTKSALHENEGEVQRSAASHNDLTTSGSDHMTSTVHESDEEEVQASVINCQDVQDSRSLKTLTSNANEEGRHDSHRGESSDLQTVENIALKDATSNDQVNENNSKVTAGNNTMGAVAVETKSRRKAKRLKCSPAAAINTIDSSTCSGGKEGRTEIPHHRSVPSEGETGAAAKNSSIKGHIDEKKSRIIRTGKKKCSPAAVFNTIESSTCSDGNKDSQHSMLTEDALWPKNSTFNQKDGVALQAVFPDDMSVIADVDKESVDVSARERNSQPLPDNPGRPPSHSDSAIANGPMNSTAIDPAKDNRLCISLSSLGSISDRNNAQTDDVMENAPVESAKVSANEKISHGNGGQADNIKICVYVGSAKVPANAIYHGNDKPVEGIQASTSVDSNKMPAYETIYNGNDTPDIKTSTPVDSGKMPVLGAELEMDLSPILAEPAAQVRNAGRNVTPKAHYKTKVQSSEVRPIKPSTSVPTTRDNNERDSSCRRKKPRHSGKVQSCEERPFKPSTNLPPTTGNSERDASCTRKKPRYSGKGSFLQSSVCIEDASDGEEHTDDITPDLPIPNKTQRCSSSKRRLQYTSPDLEPEPDCILLGMTGLKKIPCIMWIRRDQTYNVMEDVPRDVLATI